MGLYYDFILRNYIADLYYRIILWNYITELCRETESGNPWTVPGPPWDPRDPLGTPLGPPRDEPRTPGTPGDPHRPQRNSWLVKFTAPEALDCCIRILLLQRTTLATSQTALRPLWGVPREPATPLCHVYCGNDA